MVFGRLTASSFRNQSEKVNPQPILPNVKYVMVPSVKNVDIKFEFL